MEKKTPLYKCHEEAGSKIVPFAGYLLPVQYTGVIDEHRAVRTAAGLFDVSHMGEVLFEGADALAAINHLFTNDFTNMTDGRVRYSPMCNEDGGVVDDLIVYRKAQNEYLVVVNAANKDRDVAWMRTHLPQGLDVSMEDISDDVAQIALQGPKAHTILAKLVAEKDIPEKYYTFVENIDVAGVQCLISQTGYTGEHGYELYCSPQDAPALWDALLAAGKEDGLVPCGLGARDTLRLEAAMPLYGHEMDDTVTPLETGLGFAVKLDKPDFVGKSALIAAGPPKRERVGLKMTGRGIAREGSPVLLGGEQVGVTTSGTHLPYLGGAYAMALVETGRLKTGDAVVVEVRGRSIDAEVVPLPFYKKA